MKELIEKLEKLAELDTWTDEDEDFNPYEMSGGNFDDAYWAGVSDGRIELAREVLFNLKKT